MALHRLELNSAEVTLEIQAPERFGPLTSVSTVEASRFSSRMSLILSLDTAADETKRALTETLREARLDATPRNAFRFLNAVVAFGVSRPEYRYELRRSGEAIATGYLSGKRAAESRVACSSSSPRLAAPA